MLVMILAKEDVLKKLKENKDKMKSFGVKRIGIFGSVARNEMNEKSDIDIVVEFERGKATFKNVCNLIEFLEKLFDTEVDILTPDGIKSIRVKYIREKIEKEVEYV